MRAVLLVVAARFRRGWRAWLLLALLIALVSGVAMAAATAGRRAASAFPRYLAEHGFDVAVYSARPLPGLAGLPEVRKRKPRASCPGSLFGALRAGDYAGLCPAKYHHVKNRCCIVR